MLKKFKDHDSECVCISVWKSQEKKRMGTASPFNTITICVVIHYTVPDIYRAFGSWSGLLDDMLGFLYCFSYVIQ